MTRILLLHHVGGAFGYISDGYINAFKAAGCEVQRWDGGYSSWKDFNPDLYIGCSGHQQNIPDKSSRGKCKVVIHVNPYCDINIEPSINENPKIIAWVNSQQPDAVFGYGHETDVKYWRFWQEKSNIEWIPMPTGVDATIFKPNFNNDKQYDMVFIGGRWSYKAQNLDKYILPILQSTRITTSLGGWGGWPNDLPITKNYGVINSGDVQAAIQNAKIGPCVSEPHTTKYGIDLPERIFKVAFCGTLVIHDNVVGLRKYMHDVLVAENPEQFHDLIYRFANKSMDNLRLKIARSQALQVAETHTYFSRMLTMCKVLKLKNAEISLTKAKNNCVDRVKCLL